MNEAAPTIAVIAKECVPGRVKTRLTPPMTPAQAAELAAASLDDTLHTVAGMAPGRRLLYIDGVPPRSAVRLGFEIAPQSEGDLSERIAALFDAVTGPLILLGMDTPQLTAGDLRGPLYEWAEEVDAFLGRADDGGFWALAVRSPHGDLVRGVPMSRADTGDRQHDRLREHGLRVALLTTLRDVDQYADAVHVAALAPTSRFAHTLHTHGAVTPAAHVLVASGESQ